MKESKRQMADLENDNLHNFNEFPNTSHTITTSEIRRRTEYGGDNKMRTFCRKTVNEETTDRNVK